MSDLLRYLCPDEWVSRASDIDLEALRQKGIRAVIIDLDNTLVGWRRTDVPEDISEWVERAKAGGFRICIASNTYRKKRLGQMTQSLGILAASRVSKPRRGGLREALKLMEAAPEEAVMVGDQIFTDILAGRRLGLYTILVQPLTARDFISTRLNRLIERVILGHFLSRGRLRHPGQK